MAFYYDRTFKVPMWALLGSSQKNNDVIGWLKENGAVHVPWPNGFQKTVMAFKYKGWRHEIKDTLPYVLNPQLLALAVIEHLNALNPYARVDATIPLHRLDRNIRSDDDYDRIFNDVLSIQSSLNISQIFKVGELCHSGDKKHKIFVSELPVNMNSVIKVSDNIIKIGEGKEYDFNLNEKDVKKKLEEYLSGFFTN
jgi:hypothetical protein